MWRRRDTTWAAPPSGGEPVAEDDLTIVLCAIVDRRAFAPLYEKYLTWIYRHCSHHLRDPDDAWDATGVTFHKALAALDGFRGGSFEGWLHRIADHVCLGDQRRRAREAGGTIGGDRRPDGTIWVADVPGRFLIFDAGGYLLETWGSPGSGPGQFNFRGSYAVGAFAPDGSFYVSDINHWRVQRFDKDRNYLGE